MTTTIDMAKRRRVMQRSQRLGHCICDPRRPCPCAILTDQGICPCAGERPQLISTSQVKLTELVHNAGCASKIPPAELDAVLSRLPKVDDPAVISGLAAGDDAGVYRIDPQVCLVQTVDVMTPCVDDPQTFGRICATNCLSDIYAMGGTPRTALSILAFPYETLDGQIMAAMMRGAMEVFTAAGVALIGGHSIKDEEIKLGFAITGTIDPSLLVERGTARVGDVLVLTKPLGTGVVNFARQIGYAGVDTTAAETVMLELNKSAADAMAEVGASACTDVTGFGLFGHLIGMARHSGVTARIDAATLPAIPGVIEALRAGVTPGAIERNREYVGEDMVIVEDVEEALIDLGFDAQTSGGLLIAVPQDRRDTLLTALSRRGCRGAVIGEIIGESEGKIMVGNASITTESSPAETHSGTCCADAFGEQKVAGSPKQAAEAFGALMRATAADGALNARTKELINFALVVLSRCAPCVQAHFEKARQMGISEDELEEAAWCAVAMGGAPVRMFYLEALKSYKQQSRSGCC